MNKTNQYMGQLGLSQEFGHVMNIQGKIYITVAGLRVLAQRQGVVGIDLEPVLPWCNPTEGLYFMKCTVTMPDGRTFTEFGSSHKSQVGNRGGFHALMGHASTRATGRALRNALEIEIPLFEESAAAFK